MSNLHKHKNRRQHRVFAVKPKKQPTPPPEAAKLSLSERAERELERIHNAFHTGPVFRDSIADKPMPDAVCAWSILDTFEKIIKVRKGEFRLHLLEQCKEYGVPTDKGGHSAYVDRTRIVREFRQNKKPNEEDLKLLLRSKNIAITECFDEVKTYTFNASKLAYLVESGRVTQQEVDELKKTAYALKVTPSEPLAEALDNFANDVLGNPRGTKWALKSGEEEE